MDFKKEVIKILQPHLDKVDETLIEIPPDPNLGDYAYPCFILAKQYKNNPTEISKQLQKKIKPTKAIAKIQATGPYLNFFINKSILTKQTITNILKQKHKYGSNIKGKNKTLVIDFSAPNIAKPFSIGHLRSTVIGNSLIQIHKFSGYKTVGINYLGDWGTQFGKLIYAFNQWGDRKKLKKDPIKHLLKLYVKFHHDAELNPDLEDKGKEWFSKLEKGNKKARNLWKEFTDLSLIEFNKIYDLMDIKFDSYAGESFYENKMPAMIKLIKNKGITEESEGALIVPLEDKKMPPCLILKSDGSTIYATRDLTAAKHRYDKYKFDKMLYVTDFRQQLHFNQFFAVLDKMSYKWSKKCEHIGFGLVKMPGGVVLSTRKGNVVFMEEVLGKSIKLVKKIIQEKNPKLKDKDKVAEMVGIGAIIFWDLSNDWTHDLTFDWDNILNFEGETAPYVQYAHARAAAILRKAGKLDYKVKYEKLTHEKEIALVRLLSDFPLQVEDALDKHKPSVIARYTLDLAHVFNDFYSCCPCLNEKDKDIQKARLLLVMITKQTLANGLSLLGIKAPDQM
ncbi:MAG: arginine--tRNA ligase [archaeon]